MLNLNILSKKIISFPCRD